MAARRISSLVVSQSFHASLRSLGRNSPRSKGVYRYSTAAAVEEPITPPVQVNYTQLLINGQFVDATSGMILVSKEFTGKSFASWRRGMLIALSAKNKLGFIDGTYKKPAETSADFSKWRRCNDMIISWILNVLEKDIAESVIYVDSAQDVWKELNDRYGQANGPKLFQLQKEMCSISQGSSDIAGYFTSFKRHWDELNSIISLPMCTCNASAALAKYEQDQKLMQFLMGLNEEYKTIRGNLLMLEPLPTIAQAYSILLQEEKQREVSATSKFLADSASFNANSYKGGQQHHKPQYNFKMERNDSKRTNLSCKYCKKPGHTYEQCYKLLNKEKSKRIAASVQIVTSDGEQNKLQNSVSVLPGFTQDQCNQLRFLLSNKQNDKIDTDTAGVASGNFAGKTFSTLDPRTGEIIAHVAEGDTEDVNRAVAAARKAFDEGPWPKMTPYERSRIIYRFADLVEKHIDELAALETWDNGKPHEQAAKSELPMMVRLFRYYAGWADKIHGLTVPADGPHHVQILHEPIGVAGQIIPWNFPLLMFTWKVGPALACGNSIVLKTAEQTPLSALYVAKLFHEAGLPPGVLNVVSGFGPTAGAALASHMDVDKLAFTGSTDTGKIVQELAAKSNLKPVTLELGGKSPFIVCEDADVDRAVELAHFALFFNQGQCCCAGSRTYVHERVYDEFLEKAKARALRRVVGDPFKKGVEQGPQIDLEQFEKIMKYIRSGVESGATLESGGERYGSNGYYIQPTVFSNVQESMLIAKDEIFGPVQSILKFKDLEEVIKRANATHYGLAAGVFTKNIDTANTLTRALRVGTVWVNCFDVFDAAIPFGGYKMSGHGREKGIYSLNNYLQVKAVVTPLKNSAWL